MTTLKTLGLLCALAASASAQICIVECDSSAGKVGWKLDRKLAPLGVDRFLELVDDKFFDNEHLIHTVETQDKIMWGIANNPELNFKYDREAAPKLKDEPNKKKFKRGTLTFYVKDDEAKNARTCHFALASSAKGEYDASFDWGHRASDVHIAEIIDSYGKWQDYLEKRRPNYATLMGDTSWIKSKKEGPYALGNKLAIEKKLEELMEHVTERDDEKAAKHVIKRVDNYRGIDRFKYCKRVECFQGKCEKKGGHAKEREEKAKLKAGGKEL